LIQPNDLPNGGRSAKNKHFRFGRQHITLSKVNGIHDLFVLCSWLYAALFALVDDSSRREDVAEKTKLKVQFKQKVQFTWIGLFDLDVGFALLFFFLFMYQIEHFFFVLVVIHVRNV
jgi:hypothetical protein